MKLPASKLKPGDRLRIRRTSGAVVWATIYKIAPESSIDYMAPEIVFADVVFESDGAKFIRGINRFDLVDHG